MFQVNQSRDLWQKVVEIDLSTLEPHINGPFTPDLATPLSQFKSAATGDATFTSSPWTPSICAVFLFCCGCCCLLFHNLNSAAAGNWPEELKVGMIGSCTNSSYEDMARSANLAKQALDAGITAKSLFR